MAVPNYPISNYDEREKYSYRQLQKQQLQKQLYNALIRSLFSCQTVYK